MQSITAVSLLVVTLANLPLLAQPATPGGLITNGPTNRPAYLTRLQHVDGPDLLPAVFAYITLGTNKFGFVMPEGFRLETQDPQKVTLAHGDLNCLLTFRVRETESLGKTGPDAANYRELLLKRHPGAAIVDELSLV